MRKFLKIFGYILLFICISNIIMALTGYFSTLENTPKDGIRMPYSYYDAKGDYYTNVVSVLQDCGYTNIDCTATEIDGNYSLGEIVSITVKGEEYFYDNDYYTADTKIRIAYYNG